MNKSQLYIPTFHYQSTSNSPVLKYFKQSSKPSYNERWSGVRRSLRIDAFVIKLYGYRHSIRLATCIVCEDFLLKSWSTKEYGTCWVLTVITRTDLCICNRCETVWTVSFSTVPLFFFMFKFKLIGRCSRFHSDWSSEAVLKIKQF